MSDTIDLAADIVAAYVGHNEVPAADLPGLIANVHQALTRVAAGPAAETPKPELTPPVPIKKSVQQDYIVSLEDGRHYKSLKRHLSTRGLTPEQYREKWGLPASYPMVAPAYAAQRSELAKAAGLGQQRRRGAAVEAAPEPEVAEPEAVPEAPKAKRGRKKAEAA